MATAELSLETFLTTEWDGPRLSKALVPLPGPYGAGATHPRARSPLVADTLGSLSPGLIEQCAARSLAK